MVILILATVHVQVNSDTCTQRLVPCFARADHINNRSFLLTGTLTLKKQKQKQKQKKKPRFDHEYNGVNSEHRTYAISRQFLLSVATSHLIVSFQNHIV